MTRLIRTAAKWAVAGLAVAWLVKAVPLFFDSTFLPEFPIGGDDLPTRIAAAALAGLEALPETLGYIFGIVAVVVEFIWREVTAIAGNLGISAQALERGMPRVESPSINVSMAPVKAFVVMTVAQLGYFVLIEGIGVQTAHRKIPGNLVIQEGRAKLGYGILMAGLVVLLVQSIYERSLVDSVLTAVLCGIALMWPVAAGLPLYVAKLCGFRPRGFLRLIAAAGRAALLGVFESARVEAASGAGRAYSAHRGRSRGGRENSEQSSSTAPPSYEEALKMFRFRAGQYDRDAAKHRWRELMKCVHPDHGGTNASTRRIQEAYDVILEANDWSR